MLRYRFESTDQLRNHLHVNQGRSLLFFPKASVPGVGGEPIVLEVEIPADKQTSILRGKVWSRVMQSGVWLDFPDTALAQHLEDRHPPMASRRQPRVAANVMIEISLIGTGVRQAGKLLDVSAGGARIGGCHAQVGAEVDVRLPLPLSLVPREIGRATVVRNGERDVALEFRHPAPNGRAVAALVRAMEEQRRAMPVFEHAHFCCGAKGVLEPPLPRLRPRD